MVYDVIVREQNKSFECFESSKSSETSENSENSDSFAINIIIVFRVFINSVINTPNSKLVVLFKLPPQLRVNLHSFFVEVTIIRFILEYKFVQSLPKYTLQSLMVDQCFPFENAFHFLSEKFSESQLFEEGKGQLYEN